jgi:hypothetical protein
MPAPVPASRLCKLLVGLRLEHMESETLDDNYSQTVTSEKLILTQVGGVLARFPCLWAGSSHWELQVQISALC